MFSRDSEPNSAVGPWLPLLGKVESVCGCICKGFGACGGWSMPGAFSILMLGGRKPSSPRREATPEPLPRPSPKVRQSPADGGLSCFFSSSLHYSGVLVPNDSASSFGEVVLRGFSATSPPFLNICDFTDLVGEPASA